MGYQSVKDLQDQVDSLAEVVLQNRYGLDLLTADKGGICRMFYRKSAVFMQTSQGLCMTESETPTRIREETSGTLS